MLTLAALLRSLAPAALLAGGLWAACCLPALPGLAALALALKVAAAASDPLDSYGREW